MSSRFQRALDLQLKSKDNGAPMSPPRWLDLRNIPYEVQMGSRAYGCNIDESDEDVYGFFIPPKDEIFPHLAGHIPGFGSAIDYHDPKRHKPFQCHHVEDPEARKEYDFHIYNIVRYFQLCYENNPNMIDSMFVPTDCVIHITQLGQHLRENRKMFLSKRCWPTFKGFCYGQLDRMGRNPQGKRKKIVAEFGFDVKFAYHIVRNLNEVEQIMLEGDLDVRRNREQHKAIRRGEWTEEQIIEYFVSKERVLEDVYSRCKLPENPPEGKIRKLLLECLEMHYGRITQEVVTQADTVDVLRQIHTLSGKVIGI
jgi:uncharacterized protein